MEDMDFLDEPGDVGALRYRLLAVGDLPFLTSNELQGWLAPLAVGFSVLITDLI
jgi:hypothetical protein